MASSCQKKWACKCALTNHQNQSVGSTMYVIDANKKSDATFQCNTHSVQTADTKAMCSIVKE